MTDKPLVNDGQPVSTIDRLIEEIKAGGAAQAFGADQMDWGDKGGQFYECWKCEPCCGSPCNPKDGVLCCVHFSCCGLCSFSRLLATTVNQEWACWPHCISFWCCGVCSHACLRYNLRRQAGIPGNICGDCMCVWCCTCCAVTQELRSIPKSMWEWIPDKIAPPQGAAPEIQMVL
jgi:Cys-rich protein (TIGR01571 family)